MEHLRDVAVLEGVQQRSKGIFAFFGLVGFLLLLVVMLFVIIVVVIVVVILFVVILFVVILFVVILFVVILLVVMLFVIIVVVVIVVIVVVILFVVGHRLDNWCFFDDGIITRNLLAFENGLQFGQVDASVPVGVDGFHETVHFRRWQCGQVECKKAIFEFLGVNDLVVVGVESTKNIQSGHLVVVHPCSKDVNDVI